MKTDKTRFLRVTGFRGNPLRVVLSDGREANISQNLLDKFSSPSPFGCAEATYEKCVECSGSGMSISDGGDPSLCSSCRGNTVTRSTYMPETALERALIFIEMLADEPVKNSLGVELGFEEIKAMAKFEINGINMQMGYPSLVEGWDLALRGEGDEQR